MKYALVTLAAAVFTVVCSAQMISRLHLPAQVHPNLNTEYLDLERYPAFRAELPRGLSELQPAAFVISNKTNKSITGLAIRYVITDKSGVEQGFRYLTDSYISRRSAPVLAAGSFMVVAPGMFLPVELAGRGHIGGTLASTKTKHLENQRIIADASMIRAIIDVAIFSDGELAGPNSLGFPEEIQARATAARQIGIIISNSRARGESSDVALRQILNVPAAKHDKVTRWMGRFASEALNRPKRQLLADVDPLTQFDDIADPPAFRKAQ